MSEKKISYKNAGVDINLANELEDGYQEIIKNTYNKGVIKNEGGYGGLFRLKNFKSLFKKKWKDPVLVSGTDGVGTKLKIAFMMDKHDTVGIDLVAMSVNDILVQGAEPMFFLDYIGIGQAKKNLLLELVKGIANGCKQAGCTLIGGETAELPGFYKKGEYDLAGFAVGAVEKNNLITGKKIKKDDVIIALPSSGLHSNGYSLARKALLDVKKIKLSQKINELGCTLGEELIKPTTIYVKTILKTLEEYKNKKPIHALAHITGGGIVENVPRILPKKYSAIIEKGSWEIPKIFNIIQKAANIEENEMYRVFNMGVGMVMVVQNNELDKVIDKIEKYGSKPKIIGKIDDGNGEVVFK